MNFRSDKIPEPRTNTRFDVRVYEIHATPFLGTFEIVIYTNHNCTFEQKEHILNTARKLKYSIDITQIDTEEIENVSF